MAFVRYAADMKGKTTLTREELFELVWTTPMSGLGCSVWELGTW